MAIKIFRMFFMLFGICAFIWLLVQLVRRILQMYVEANKKQEQRQQQQQQQRQPNDTHRNTNNNNNNNNNDRGVHPSAFRTLPSVLEMQNNPMARKK